MPTFFKIVWLYHGIVLSLLQNGIEIVRKSSSKLKNFDLFMEIIYSNLVFIISVSLQLVGSIVLMFHALPFRRRDLVRAFFRNSFSVRHGEEIRYDHQLFILEGRRIYTTWLAIACLCAGYVLQVFSTKTNDEPIWIGLAIIIFTAVLYLLVFGISYCLSRIIASKEVTSDELKQCKVDTNMAEATEEDIKQVLAEIEDDWKKSINPA